MTHCGVPDAVLTCRARHGSSFSLMIMRRFPLLVGAVALLVACGRKDKAADSTAAKNDSAGAVAAPSDSAGISTLKASGPVGDPPPPPFDTTAALFMNGASAAAGATAEDSALVNFHYDTAGTGYKATFSTRDSATVDGATLTGSGSTITGTGKITAKLKNGTVVVDFSKGIAPSSNLSKCSNPAGQGKCGRVTFDSAQYTPKNGRAQTRKVRVDLGP